MSANVKEILQQAAGEAMVALFGNETGTQELVIQTTPETFAGDFTLVLFPLLKLKLGSPDELGRRLGEQIKQRLEIVSDYSVVKGFLNFTLSDAYWLGFLAELSAYPQNFYRQEMGKGQRVMVEFASPNTNKPLHLGHLRNIFLGDAVSRLLQALGYEVIRANLINDRGIHICKSMLAWQRFGGGEVPSASLKGDHLVGKYYVRYEQAYRAEVAEAITAGQSEEEAQRNAPIQQAVQEMLRQWEAGDPNTRALWSEMNEWVYAGFATTFARIGVRFDKYYYESQTYLLGKTLIEEGLEKGVFFRKPDGSVWIDLTAEGLDEKLLLRGDGTSVYITQDLGTSEIKFTDYHAQRHVYVIANEQDYHMKVLIAILRRLGRSYAEGMYHLSYAMVELPSGRMKSREGTVVDADDLIAEMVAEAQKETLGRGKVESHSAEQLTELYETLGLGALKYYLLRVSPTKKMLFDPAESVSLQGDTGPFIQYTHARIQSLLEKAGSEHDLDGGTSPTEVIGLDVHEKAVLRTLNAYPETIREAAHSYNPSILASYLVDLAKAYNRFYYELPILRAPNAASRNRRIVLSKVTARTIKEGMHLLGIAVPDRM